MATHNGSEGLVHVGTDAVGELRSWQFTENANMIDTTVLSDTAQTFSAGSTSWSGSAECFLDETDTAQTALTIGSSATLKFYFEGSTSGDKYYTGTGLVESVDRSAAQDDIVSVSFSFRGTGALTLATV
nr:phage major tail protein 2 [uncultured Mediterranean phage uvMED]